ncbi:MAG: DNA polymerase III subunit delta' [Phycisphaerae bacterium]
MRFRDVKHQERALSILRRALASGRTHHAYLFDGPDGVGKELAARALAARLLCNLPPDANAGMDACGTCASCKLFAGGSHPDFHLIERSLHKLHPEPNERRKKGLELGVNVVRHFLIDHASASPAVGRRRIFVVREAERMNEEAQNALLKTLEEPPGSACLVLVTSSAARLLSTIRSRCQRIPFGLLPPAFVREKLVTLASMNDETATALARLCDGRLGVALRWHKIDLLAAVDSLAGTLGLCIDEPDRFAKAVLETTNELALRAKKADTPAAEALDEPLPEIEAAADEDEDEEAESRASSKKIATDQLRDATRLSLLVVATLLRDALLAGENAGAMQIFGKQAVVRQLSQRWSQDELSDAIRAIATAETMIERNVSPQLALERFAAAARGAAGV